MEVWYQKASTDMVRERRKGSWLMARHSLQMILVAISGAGPSRSQNRIRRADELNRFPVFLGYLSADSSIFTPPRTMEFHLRIVDRARHMLIYVATCTIPVLTGMHEGLSRGLQPQL